METFHGYMAKVDPLLTHSQQCNRLCLFLTGARDGLLDVSVACSSFIFNTSTADLCLNEYMESIIWLLIICERRVSKEFNRVEWHSSVHHNIISSSCPLNWTDKVIPWGVRPNFIANELKTWWQLFLLALVRIWDFLPATGHKWILIPLVLAVLALVEDIFSREVIKLGTYFQMFKTIFRYWNGFLLFVRKRVGKDGSGLNLEKVGLTQF